MTDSEREAGENGSQKPNNSNRQDKKKPSLWFILLILALIASLNFLNKNGGATHEDAYAECQAQITRRLQNPSSITFPDATSATFVVDDDKYTVTSHLMLQGTSGEPVRTGWLCELKYMNTGFSIKPGWALLNLQVD